MGAFSFNNKLSLWDIDKALNLESFVQPDIEESSIYPTTYQTYTSILYLPEKKKFVSSYFSDMIYIRDSEEYILKHINFARLNERNLKTSNYLIRQFILKKFKGNF